MLARMRWAVALFGMCIVAFLSVQNARAQQVREYEENGVRVRETRTTVQRPVVEKHLQPRERIVYREQVTTELQPAVRNVYTPVTTYRWKARWQDVINPFKPVTPHLVPQTHWQVHLEQTEAPVVRRQYVPQKEVVNVPVTTRRFVNDEVVRRTVVSAAPGVSGGTVVARRGPAIGGIQRIDGDTRRTGNDWKPADSYRR